MCRQQYLYTNIKTQIQTDPNADDAVSRSINPKRVRGTRRQTLVKPTIYMPDPRYFQGTTGVGANRYPARSCEGSMFSRKVLECLKASSMRVTRVDLKRALRDEKEEVHSKPPPITSEYLVLGI